MYMYVHTVDVQRGFCAVFLVHTSFDLLFHLLFCLHQVEQRGMMPGQVILLPHLHQSQWVECERGVLTVVSNTLSLVGEGDGVSGRSLKTLCTQQANLEDINKLVNLQQRHLSPLYS